MFFFRFDKGTHIAKVIMSRKRREKKDLKGESQQFEEQNFPIVELNYVGLKLLKALLVNKSSYFVLKGTFSLSPNHP